MEARSPVSINYVVGPAAYPLRVGEGLSRMPDGRGESGEHIIIWAPTGGIHVSALRTLKNAEDGGSAAEYAILAASVAVVILMTVYAVGQLVPGLFAPLLGSF